MILGEVFFVDGEIELNVGFDILIFEVFNIGDCLVQVGSYYYFVEINLGLFFDWDKVCGMWLDILVGIVVCFEFGQICFVMLVFYCGNCIVYGFNQYVMGSLGG